MPLRRVMDLNIYPALPQRRDFRIGILGSGFVVNECHLVAYRKAGFNPVGIASRTRENAARVAERHRIARVYDTFDQLLDDPSIEVLDIAVPPNVQLDLIKAACARKTVKGILAHKPLANSYADSIDIVRACDDAGITLAVNQNMRFDHSVRAAKTLLGNGTIGTPVFTTLELRVVPHWVEWHKRIDGLTLRNISIHHLDTFRYWFGEPGRDLLQHPPGSAHSVPPCGWHRDVCPGLSGRTAVRRHRRHLDGANQGGLRLGYLPALAH